MLAGSDLSPPGFAGTNDGDGFQASDSKRVYSTNDLWLEMLWVDTTNNLAYLTLHDTIAGEQYQLLSKTNLLQSGDWTLGEIITGASGTNQTDFSPVAIADNPMMFFWAHQAEPIGSLLAGQDAVEPQGTDSGQIGIISLNVNLNGITNGLTVFYRISGTASNGIDYTNLNGAVTLQPNENYAEIHVQPLADNLVEGVETVTLTLMPTNTYLIYPGQDVATIHIFDSSSTISIEAGSDAIEPNGPPQVPALHGSFHVSRADSRGILTNLVVNYLVSGTASNGVDYSSLSGTLNFAPDMTDTNIDINPLEDDLPEGLETVTLTLLATNTYLADASHSTATISINDSSTTVGIYVQAPDAVEPGQTDYVPGETGSFYLLRSDSRSIYTNLTVSYLISGTASNGLDYATLSGAVTFAPGAVSTNIYIQPLADYLIEGDETVTLTLIPTNGYFIDTNSAQGTVTIHDSVYFMNVTNLEQPVGIDYQAPSNSLIVSSASSGSFVRIYTSLFLSNSVVLTNVVVTNWSGVHGLPDEVKLATPKATIGGFTNGDVFFSSSTGIGWLSADGSRSNLNWSVLTNSAVTNGLPLRGGLYVDQTGTWSNKLIVVTSPGTAAGGNKGVWLVNSNGQPTLVASINTPHLEGVITLTNDVARWGPWAGKIITGDEDAPPNGVIYTIATNGVVTPYDTTMFVSGGIRPEDFDIIPPNQDLYGCDEITHSIVKFPRGYFANYVGDLLVTDEMSIPSKVCIIHWNAATTNFTAIPIPFKHAYGQDGQFEHVTFAPIDLPAQ